MDLKVFYQNLRQMEASISDAHVVIVSQKTPDGGRPGVKTEVPRSVAAQMIIEGKARLASEAEATEYREQAAEAKRIADQTAAASRVLVTVVSDAELRALKGSGRPKA